MAQCESMFFLTGVISLAISLVAAISGAITNRIQTARHQAVRGLGIPRFIHIITLTGGLIAISVSLIIRAINTGHGPFSSMYEFAVAFAWGILVMALIFNRIYKLPLICIVGDVMALILLIFAGNLSSQAAPLVPALQQSLLLTTHVASAVISYGALTIGFGAAIAYLFKSQSEKEAQALDHLSYHTVIIGFPFLTLVIILGAVWADIAWGRYWNWDPKETASLVTWLLYAGYLHARITRGWRGKKAAVLLIIGFAAVLLTFFGNYIFSGLHAYA